MSSVSRFLGDETGALNVEWVVVASGLVALALAVVGVTTGGVEHQATQIDEAMNAPSVLTRFAKDFEHTAHDQAAFHAMMRSLSRLDDADLAQITGFTNAAMASDLSGLDADTRGALGDLNAAIDVIYADRRITRPSAGGYDVAEVDRISAALSYDPIAIAATN